MDAAAYDSFRRAVDERLRGNVDGPAWGVQTADPVAAALVEILHEAARTVTAVGDALDRGTALDRNKYDFALSMIDRILSFDEWVLAEYTYELASGARPGIRLALEVGAVGRQVSVMLFEDTRRWRIDDDGRKVSYELLTLLLGPAAPAPHVAVESLCYFDSSWDWRWSNPLLE